MIPNTALTRLENSDLDLVHIGFGEHTALVSRQGAQLVSCIHSGAERLWLSPNAHFKKGSAIRGGVPICWPWFGQHPQDKDKPAHGPARKATWNLLNTGENTDLSFAEFDYLCEDPDYNCLAKLRVELDEIGLRIQLTSNNTGKTPLIISEALHSYLPISDLSTAFIDGLESTRYADKLLDYAESVETRHQLYLTEPTDRIYFDTSQELQLIDTQWQRRTKIEKRGSSATVVWNPGSKTASAMADLGEDHYRGFVCIESANALTASITLAPGETHCLEQRLKFI